MQLSFITLILSVAVAVFAQIEVDDPVKMDANGNIIPAGNAKRSQFEEFKKRQIDEAIPVKMDAEGNIFPAVKRSAEPMILEVLPGTDLHEPVRMDAFGRIVKA